MALPVTLTRQEAQDHVRELAQMCWPVFFKKHAVYRTATRQVSQADVLKALLRGSVVADPTWDTEYTDWKINVEATLDDVFLRVHVALDEERPERLMLAVVTVIANDI